MNDNLQEMTNISVVDPISPAIEWTKKMLFRPFDIGKWFTIGFCAWLAFLGEGGGFHSNFGGSGGGDGGRPGIGFEEMKGFVLEHLMWIITIGISVFVVIMVVSVIVMWLKSRGRFMFFHCVALNKAEVVVPWNKYCLQGNSLFLFRLVLGIISSV